MTEKVKVFQIDLTRFQEANKDYVQRIEREGLIAIYDSTLDTLFLEIGGTREAITDPVVDNIMVRIDPVTLEIVGLEVYDFLDDFVPANRFVRELLSSWHLSLNEDSQKTLIGPGIAEVARTLISQLALSRS